MDNMEHDDMPDLEADAPIVVLDSEDELSEDFEEDEIYSDELTNCLFCTKLFPNVENGIIHIRDEHRISFSYLKTKFEMDQYSFLKLINCIRVDGITAKQLSETDHVFWNDEKYLKPIQYEPWLSYDYEELLPEMQLNKPNEVSVLRTLVKNLQEKVKEQAQMLEQSREDMEKMRTSFQRVIAKDTGSPTKNNKKCLKGENGLIAPLRDDDGYFSGYAHFSIHHEMLSDTVRTTSYRDALLKNAEFVLGKDVLDVGCGTSILSIFASQAGAKHVIGIDNSDIIYNAMDILKNNNIKNVQLIKGRLEDTELPQEKFDIIISEWMGYFLLFEGMLDTIIYARDNHLKPNGIVLPNRCTMSMVGYGSEELYQNQVSYWENVYGVNMSNMKNAVLNEPLIETVDPEHILTKPNQIADFNLMTVNLNYSNFSYEFTLECSKSGNLSALVGYFDTYFDLPIHPVMFGTSPTDTPTHWKQVIFFLDNAVAVNCGDKVCGKITCARSTKNVRSLDIEIEIFDKKYSYYLD